MDGCGPHLPVGVALERGSDELRRLMERLERIEHHLEALCFDTKSALGSEMINALQEIDLIVQSTEALADFIRVVAGQPGARDATVCLQDALGTVRLRDLAARLSGEVETAARDGDLELF